jgi:hypothetical protein
MRFLIVLAVLCTFATAAFVCRSPPFDRIGDDALLNNVCDCCDCSDEPGSELRRSDCVQSHAATEAVLRKDAIALQLRKAKLPDAAAAVKASAARHRDRVRSLEESVKHATALEAIVHNRRRTALRAKYSTALDAIAAGATTTQLQEWLTTMASKHALTSGEWVAEALSAAGFQVDKTDAIFYSADCVTLHNATSTAISEEQRVRSLLQAFGLRGSSDAELRRAWKAVALLPNGCLVLDNVNGLPQHWNETELEALPEANTARTSYEDARADEKDYIALEQHFDNKMAQFNYGPRRLFASLDGRCFPVTPPVRGEPGWKLARPSVVCLYRFARYSKFTEFVDDLRADEQGRPLMVFREATLMSACKTEGGHQTLVSFACHHDEGFLFSTPLSRCAINVTIGTPLGC